MDSKVYQQRFGHVLHHRCPSNYVGRADLLLPSAAEAYVDLTYMYLSQGHGAVRGYVLAPDMSTELGRVQLFNP